MPYRHLREESGTGQLEAQGQPTLEIRYHIDVSQRILDDGRGGEIPGLFHIEGRLFPENPWTLIAYLGAAVQALPDGRRWECNVVNNGGQLSNRQDRPPF